MIIKKHFTFDQFLAETQVDHSAGHAKKYGTSSTDTGLHNADFTGTKDWSEAINYARFGWPAGTKKLKKALDGIKTATAPTLEQFFDVTGEELDISLYITEEPECMVDYRLVNSDGIKFIDIYVSFAYHCGHSADEVVKRGALILSNIDGLESNGYRCRVIGYSKNGYRSGRGYVGLDMEVILKEHDENLELDRMAFCLINPSMLRRLGFKLIERFQPKQSNKNYGRGLDFQAPENALHIDRDMFSSESINGHFKYKTKTE